MHKVEIEVGRDILKRNKEEATQNLKLLKENNIKAFDILGSIGSGKTSIIEKVVPILERKGLKSVQSQVMSLVKMIFSE